MNDVMVDYINNMNEVEASQTIIEKLKLKITRARAELTAHYNSTPWDAEITPEYDRKTTKLIKARDYAELELAQIVR